MYKQVKDQRAWQLEQGRELSALREKVDAVQDTGVASRVLDNQTALGLASLDGRIETLEGQGRFLLDRQEQDSNVWHNVAFNLREVQEGEQKIAALQDLLDVQTLGAEGVLPVRATFTLALSSAGCNRSGPTAEGTCSPLLDIRQGAILR